MKLFKNSKRNKGFAIAEVVVALAIIAVVSMITIATINNCITSASKNYYYSEAKSLSKDMIECFKYSHNRTEFTDSVDYLGINVEHELDNYTYRSKYYSLEVNVTYNTNRFGKCSYIAFCYDEKGNLLFQHSYDKYGEKYD